jgi:hypothetical protein
MAGGAGVQRRGTTGRAWGRTCLVLVPGAAFLLVFVLRTHASVPGFSGFTLFDDAMISMSYGRTLVRTGQWVWFPGAPRVQGFTNPLWTLYMAGLHALGLEGSRAALVVSLTGVILVLACAVVVAHLVRVALRGQRYADWTALTAAATVPFLYPLVFWSLRGMEVGLLALLALGMVTSVVELLRRWEDGRTATPALVALAATAVLGILTRLDFALPAAVVGLLSLAWAPDRRARTSLALVAGIPMAVATAGLLLFQKLYFGDWLPNTYRLKMGGTSVSERLIRGAVASGKVLPVTLILAGAIAVVLWSAVDRLTKRTVILLGSVWACVLVYSLWVGGDAWEWARMANRYLAIGLPAVVAVVFIALAQLLETRVALGVGGMIAVAVVVLSGVAYGAKTNPFAFDSRDAVSVTFGLLVALVVCVWAAQRAADRSAGDRAAAIALVAAFLVVMVSVSVLPAVQWLKDAGPHVHDDALMTARGIEMGNATDGDAVIATAWAGAPAYYSERPMVDLLGKSDRRIAASAPHRVPNTKLASFFPGHDKWDVGYSVGVLRPDILFQMLDKVSSTDLDRWGYVRRCLSDGTIVFVLQTSTHVDMNRLTECA